MARSGRPSQPRNQDNRCPRSYLPPWQRRAVIPNLPRPLPPHPPLLLVGYFSQGPAVPGIPAQDVGVHEREEAQTNGGYRAKDRAERPGHHAHEDVEHKTEERTVQESKVRRYGLTEGGQIRFEGAYQQTEADAVAAEYHLGEGEYVREIPHLVRAMCHYQLRRREGFHSIITRD